MAKLSPILVDGTSPTSRAKMDVDQAVDILKTYGSDSDPIFYRGKETTAYDLLSDMDQQRQASKVRIEFAGSTGRGIRWLRGSLRDMVFERMDLRPRARLPRARRRRAS